MMPSISGSLARSSSQAYVERHFFWLSAQSLLTFSLIQASVVIHPAFTKRVEVSHAY